MENNRRYRYSNFTAIPGIIPTDTFPYVDQLGGLHYLDKSQDQDVKFIYSEPLPGDVHKVRITSDIII